MLNLKWFKKGLTILTLYIVGIPFWNMLLSYFRNGTSELDLTTLVNPLTPTFEEVANIFNISNGIAYNIIVYAFSYILFINVCLLILEVLMYILGLIRKFLEKGGKE